VTQLEGIWESGHLYAYQNTLLPSLTCSVVTLYQGTDNILEIYHELSTEIPGMYHR
jgi:hypothetical protein